MKTSRGSALYLLNPEDPWPTYFNAGSAEVALKRHRVIRMGEDYLLRAFFDASHTCYALIGVNIIGALFVYLHRIYRANLSAGATVGTGFDFKDAWRRELGNYSQTSFFGVVYAKFR